MASHAQRTFPRDQRAIHPVGFGAMSFAGFYGPTTEDESLATLARALELGVNHWDTANVYGDGHSERVIGKFFKANPSARARIHLATKGSIKRDPQTGARTFDNSRDHLRAMLEASLTRLGVSKVDLYYIHRREAARPVEEVQETLVRFMEEGLIGGIGYSEVAPTTIRRAHAVHPVTAVQSEYSLWTRTPEIGVTQACKELGITFVPFSPLGRAMLANGAPSPDTLAKGDFRNGNPRFTQQNYAANAKTLAPFHAMAKRKDVASATLALAWVLHQGDTMVPIPGTRSITHLEENAAARDLVLTQDDLAEIARMLPPGFAQGDRYSDAQWPGVERYS